MYGFSMLMSMLLKNGTVILERSTVSAIKMIEYIQEIGYIQNQTFGDVFPDVSEYTVLRDLQDLIKKGLLKKIGSTKSARYAMV